MKDINYDVRFYLRGGEEVSTEGGRSEQQEGYHETGLQK